MAAITPQNAYGYSRVHFVKAQATFDTHLAMAATDGFKCMDMKLQPSKAWEDRKEGNGTASKQAPLAGKRGGKFNAKFHLMPQTSGTPMDAGPFLKSAFGTETGSVYTLSSTANPIQLAECAIGEKWDEASGAVVEQIEFDVSQADAPTITASGSYARHIWAYRGSAASGAAGQAVATLTAGHDGNFSVDSYVTLTGSGNDNRQVITVTPATPSITLASNITTELGADSQIIPYCPTPTIAGNTIPMGVHALTIDGVTYSFSSAKVVAKTGFGLRDKEATSDRASGIIHGPREISFEAQMYWFDAKQSALLGKAWDGTTHAIVLRIGENTTAKRCTISIPACRFDVTPVDLPEAEASMCTIKGVAQMNAASDDEMVVTFD